MAASYEEIFLAIAVRNRIIAHEIAVSSLAEFRALPADSRGNIGAFMTTHGRLTAPQVGLLEAGTRKILCIPETNKLPATASATVRVSNNAEPIAGFSILRKLGTGGTATVFLAEDRNNRNRRVALKILHPSRMKDDKALDCFLREAELLVRFDHPNLVKGHTYGRAGPLAYLVMEFLEGESVDDILVRERALPEARAIEIILEIAKALEYTQGQGIVHRDIKPGNIVVLGDGRVKLCDLGFALPIGAMENDEETTSGTVQYMSPEQARGQRDIDVRADIYSLGASLYHMVMGELPFSGADSLEVMAKQVMEALNSSEIKNRRISKHMHYFIERMMSKEKDFRYGSARELIDDITEQMEGFRSLEYDPGSTADRKTRILKGLSGPTPAPRTPSSARYRALKPTTRRLPPKP